MIHNTRYYVSYIIRQQGGPQCSGFLTTLMGITCIRYDHDIALHEYSQGRATRPRAFPCSPSPHALHLILPLQVLLLPATYIGFVYTPTHCSSFVRLPEHEHLDQSGSLGALVRSSKRISSAWCLQHGIATHLATSLVQPLMYA